jgi:hydroxymethylpyrimidine kinase/phosphomethylpyrimidine kinase
MRPVVLCFSGLDPSGGAGLQADIESIAALNAHAAVVCTALTIQDSQQVYGFETVNADLLYQQAQKVLADLPVKAIKCGMLGSLQTVEVVKRICQQHPHIPLVLDPVLAANSGGSLTLDGFIDTLKTLFSFADVITPNTLEAERLTGLLTATNEAELIQALLKQGAQSVLLKGGHEQGQMLRNRLYQQGQLVQTSQWPRLAGEFHGSGCSLASAIAAGLAHGLSLPIAVTRAEVWLHHTLQEADFPHAQGQAIPRRI